MGWVIQQHGFLYAREYGWDCRFEAFAARIAADFIDNHDPVRERCWIAERAGEPLGCVFLVKHRELTGYRAGTGGAECTRFAREAGYTKIVLWTNSILTAARHLYEREQYRLTEKKPHQSFGLKLVGQMWELVL